MLGRDQFPSETVAMNSLLVLALLVFVCAGKSCLGGSMVLDFKKVTLIFESIRFVKSHSNIRGIFGKRGQFFERFLSIVYIDMNDYYTKKNI